MSRVPPFVRELNQTKRITFRQDPDKARVENELQELDAQECCFLVDPDCAVAAVHACAELHPLAERGYSPNSGGVPWKPVTRSASPEERSNEGKSRHIAFFLEWSLAEFVLWTGVPVPRCGV